MRFSLLMRSLALMASFVFSAGVLADVATTTFSVTARARASCLVSASDLNFGDYVPSTGDVDAQAAVTVRCTRGTSFQVALSGGATPGSSISQRLMASGVNTLQYNLFTNAARTSLWGDGTTGVQVAGTGNGLSIGSAQTLDIFGRLPDSVENQDAPPGATRIP